MAMMEQMAGKSPWHCFSLPLHADRTIMMGNQFQKELSLWTDIILSITIFAKEVDRPETFYTPFHAGASIGSSAYHNIPKSIPIP